MLPVMLSFTAKKDQSLANATCTYLWGPWNHFSALLSSSTCVLLARYHTARADTYIWPMSPKHFPFPTGNGYLLFDGALEVTCKKNTYRDFTLHISHNTQSQWYFFLPSFFARLNPTECGFAEDPQPCQLPRQVSGLVHLALWTTYQKIHRCSRPETWARLHLAYLFIYLFKAFCHLHRNEVLSWKRWKGSLRCQKWRLLLWGGKQLCFYKMASFPLEWGRFSKKKTLDTFTEI